MALNRHKLSRNVIERLVNVEEIKMVGDSMENRLCLVVSKKELGVNYKELGFKVLNLKNIRRYIGDDTPEKLEMQSLVLQLIYYDEITVKVKVVSDGAVMVITVTDKNKPFSFNDTINFKNKDDYDGGLGAEIFKENRNKLHFRYQDGWNVYKIKAPMSLRYMSKEKIKARNYVTSNFVGVVDDIQCDIQDKISNRENTKFVWMMEALSELLSNVFFHRDQDSTRYFKVMDKIVDVKI